MVMEDDWDLNAVVRGCTTFASASSSSTSIIATTTTSSYSAAASGFPTAFDSGRENQMFSLSDPFESRNSSEELHELYKPFFRTKSQPSTCSFSHSTAPTEAKAQQKQKQAPNVQSGTTKRSQRRKNRYKKVCQVPAEALSADIWSWRKYGQKPIKGSPYPRGYYRCSSTKGCLARKQVERNRFDPEMFIVTYAAEHNHPAPTHKNSLAGSTRQKPTIPKATPVTPRVGEDEGVPRSTISKSKEEDKEDFVDYEEENDFGLPDMELTDDFFTGFDEFTSPSSLPDHFPATMAIPS